MSSSWMTKSAGKTTPQLIFFNKMVKKRDISADVFDSTCLGDTVGKNNLFTEI